jgi:hypothetical protein
MSTETRMAYAATPQHDSSIAYAISVATPGESTAETVAGWIKEGAIVYCVSPQLASEMFGRWLDKQA